MTRLIFLTPLLLLTPFLSGCTSIPRGLDPVEGFDVDRYLGTWYEIARLDHSFERGLTHVTATYTEREDGRIGVLNQGFNQKKDKWTSAEAVARFQGDPSVGSLTVTFRWPFSGGYHVVALDEDYQWAVVTGPTRKYFWILSREPVMDEAIIEKLVNKADEWGFPVEELIFVKQLPMPDLPRPS